MHAASRIALLAAVLLLAGAAAAQGTGQALWTEDAADGRRVHLYFFWSEGCPHCQAARPFVEAIPRARPWVLLHSLEVSRNPANAREFETLAQSLGERAESVPTLAFCGRMSVGWQDEATTGAGLLAALDACRAGAPLPRPEAAARLPLVGDVESAALSLPLFTVVVAGLDAFNPCAFFVLMFLLGLLAGQDDRRRMLAVGAVFVLASGVMYFAFMAAWLNVFRLLGALAWITPAAGLLAVAVGAIGIKDFFAFRRGLTLSIPESAKPRIYRRAREILQSKGAAPMLSATVLLAVVANFYELLCTAGFPMVYTRVLTLHEPSAAARYAWLALYNAVYVLPLGLIVLACVGTLAAHRLSEREVRLLKLVSGTMMLELGLVLAIAPAWLNSLGATALLVGVALAVGAAAARFGRRGERIG